MIGAPRNAVGNRHRTDFINLLRHAHGFQTIRAVLPRRFQAIQRRRRDVGLVARERTAFGIHHVRRTRSRHFRANPHPSHGVHGAVVRDVSRELARGVEDVADDIPGSIACVARKVHANHPTARTSVIHACGDQVSTLGALHDARRAVRQLSRGHGGAGDVQATHLGGLNVDKHERARGRIPQRGFPELCAIVTAHARDVGHGWRGEV
mmetsp:Transcript_3900/g.14134  ORF Transcript_3900/g.14134 Transcript_3900/m.14134 type:complete len:208 (-) Transcript_3900:13-636(-)